MRAPLSEARTIAGALVAVLGPACERIEVAGSIRRGRPDVGDIELVAVPRRHADQVEVGFFDAIETEVNELNVLVDTLVLQGTLAPHPTDPKRGERYAKLQHRESGLQVDLFSARPETFGLILLIRTGPAGYSQRLVTDARRRALHVAGGELHRGALGCGAYRCEVVPTPEERDVFDALRLPFVEPERRA